MKIPGKSKKTAGPPKAPSTFGAAASADIPTRVQKALLDTKRTGGISEGEYAILSNQHLLSQAFVWLKLMYVSVSRYIIGIVAGVFWGIFIASVLWSDSTGKSVPFPPNNEVGWVPILVGFTIGVFFGKFLHRRLKQCMFGSVSAAESGMKYYYGGRGCNRFEDCTALEYEDWMNSLKEKFIEENTKAGKTDPTEMSAAQTRFLRTPCNYPEKGNLLWILNWILLLGPLAASIGLLFTTSELKSSDTDEITVMFRLAIGFVAGHLSMVVFA